MTARTVGSRTIQQWFGATCLLSSGVTYRQCNDARDKHEPRFHTSENQFAVESRDRERKDSNKNASRKESFFFFPRFGERPRSEFRCPLPVSRRQRYGVRADQLFRREVSRRRSFAIERRPSRIVPRIVIRKSVFPLLECRYEERFFLFSHACFKSTFSNHLLTIYEGKSTRLAST